MHLITLVTSIRCRQIYIQENEAIIKCNLLMAVLEWLNKKRKVLEQLSSDIGKILDENSITRCKIIQWNVA